MKALVIVAAILLIVTSCKKERDMEPSYKPVIAPDVMIRDTVIHEIKRDYP